MFYCLEVRKVQKMAIVYCIFFQVMVRFKELKKSNYLGYQFREGFF